MTEQASQVEVRRSGLKMWLLSLAGVPLLVLGVDVLRNRRIISFFQNLIWPNGNGNTGAALTPGAAGP